MDVAISFLARDEALALDFRDRLTETLSVFVFSKEQEQLAGTEGLESFRQAFRTAARLVVVLYRDPWGRTPWTGVEQTAITDRALAEGWDFLLFVTLDHSSSLPSWLPDTRIRFSLQQYGIDQAVGAIKVRVEQLGGELHPLGAVDRARLAAARLERRAQREQRLRGEGHHAVMNEGRTLLDELARILESIRQDAPSLRVAFDSRDMMCFMRTPGAGTRVRVVGTNPIRESRVTERLYLGSINLLGENGGYDVEPEEQERFEYFFDIRDGVGWCWVLSDRLFTSSELAEHIVSRFIAFAERVASGEVRQLREY